MNSFSQCYSIDTFLEVYFSWWQHILPWQQSKILINTFFHSATGSLNLLSNLPNDKPMMTAHHYAYFLSLCVIISSPTAIVQILLNSQLYYNNSLLNYLPSSPVFLTLSCIPITSGNTIPLLKILQLLLSTYRIKSKSLSRAYEGLCHWALACNLASPLYPSCMLHSHNTKLLEEWKHTVLFSLLCLWPCCVLFLKHPFSPLQLARSSCPPSHSSQQWHWSTKSFAHAPSKKTFEELCTHSPIFNMIS